MHLVSHKNLVSQNIVPQLLVDRLLFVEFEKVSDMPTIWQKSLIEYVSVLVCIGVSIGLLMYSIMKTRRFEAIKDFFKINNYKKQ